MTVPEAQFEFKKGGQYRIIMQNKDKEQFIAGASIWKLKPLINWYSAGSGPPALTPLG